MPNKFVGAFKFLTQGARKGKVSPTITQPRQLKKTMEGIRSKYKKFAFKEAKTAKDRANIVRTKKSIERMTKLDKAKAKRKEGIKASKEIKKMIGTGQADRVGGSVYHRGIREKKALGGIIQKFKKKARPDNKGQKLTPDQSKKLKEGIREKKAEGGILGKAKKFLGKEAPKREPKSKEEINRIVNSDAYKKADYKTKTKMLGGNVSTAKEMEDRIKKQKPGIKEKILPQKKKDRLNELRKELGMKKGGKAKFPDLTGDGKVTQADILKGRGVFKKGGGVKQMIKTVTSPITRLRNKMSKRKFGQGKGKK